MATTSMQFNMERFFQALGDSTRLRLLNLLGEKEVSVIYLAEILGHGQAKITQQLAFLRRAGVVEARRDGKWLHYRIATPKHRAAARVLRDTLAGMHNDWRMRADRAHLARKCGHPTVSESIDAPLPVGCRGMRKRLGVMG
ncbi:MAG: metalloregulator ArsR/SmtB family transcription factor [Acidobacteriaceae bacterium]|nr:metalloregulator ArsR/SmtB family transcription factor [Acidobacteriaceae bacterium]